MLSLARTTLLRWSQPFGIRMILFFGSFTSLTFLSLHGLLPTIHACLLTWARHRSLIRNVSPSRRLLPPDNADTTAYSPLHHFLAFAFAPSSTIYIYIYMESITVRYGERCPM